MNWMNCVRVYSFSSHKLIHIDTFQSDLFIFSLLPWANIVFWVHSAPLKEIEIPHKIKWDQRIFFFLTDQMGRKVPCWVSVVRIELEIWKNRQATACASFVPPILDERKGCKAFFPIQMLERCAKAMCCFYLGKKAEQLCASCDFLLGCGEVTQWKYTGNTVQTHTVCFSENKPQLDHC